MFLYWRGVALIFELLWVLETLAHKSQRVEELFLGLASDLRGDGSKLFSLSDTSLDWVLFLVNWINLVR